MPIATKLVSIEAKRLNEVADEIFAKVGSEDIRPSGDPDYWLFGEPSTQVMANNGLLLFEGEPGQEVSFGLWEQDAGFRWSDDDLGTVKIVLGENSVNFVPTYATTYVGRNVEGQHVVEFHGSDSHYRLAFTAYITQQI